jgi:hypothetical protein
VVSLYPKFYISKHVKFIKLDSERSLTVLAWHYLVFVDFIWMYVIAMSRYNLNNGILMS